MAPSLIWVKKELILGRWGYNKIRKNMNKKIAIELAMGIILIVAVIIGGFLWLGNNEKGASVKSSKAGIEINTGGKAKVDVQRGSGKTMNTGSVVVSGDQVDKNINVNNVDNEDSAKIQINTNDNSKIEVNGKSY